MREQGRVLIGESLVGEADEAAHVSTVPSARESPAGTAWATAPATPRHAPANPFFTPG